MRLPRKVVQKELGAFYTCEPVVAFLVRWGLERAPGVVFDPACGDGRFLDSAAEFGAQQLVGCDVDPFAVECTARRLGKFAKPVRLFSTDFFALDPTCGPKVDLVVGNPPFIRYQRFAGNIRQRALASALKVGVRLTRLTSAWAPFLLHAIQFLKPGGAMAVVVPAEIVQTQYGIPALRGLCSRFRRVQLLLFERNFFVDAQTETYLLLAEDYGASSVSVELHPLCTIDELGDFASSISTANVPVDLAISEPIRFAQVFLTPNERAAWRHTVSRAGILRLADCGTITNGYVSGANDFFHRTVSDALKDNIPPDWLLPTVRNARSLRGIEFTEKDVEVLEADGRAHHLLSLPDDDLFNPHPQQLRQIVSEGKKQQISGRFKCRVRLPWWRVPGIHVPDVFVPYMIGRCPVASANAARATHTNTIHGLHLARGYDAHTVVFSLLCTLSLLSMELEGRSYGGGVLKLEPSEASRVQLTVPGVSRQLVEEADHLLRSGRYSDAVDLADEVVLRQALGLESDTMALLRNARTRLVDRRFDRTRGKSKRCHYESE